MRPVAAGARRRRDGLLVLAACVAVVLIAGLIIAGNLRDDDAPPTVTSTSATTAAPVTTIGGTTIGATAPTTVAIPVTTASTVRPGPTSTPGTAGTVSTGTWGGRGIRVVVGAGGGSVDYDCAVGSILEPLVVNSGGFFEAGGTHTVLRGGPPEPGTVPRVQPARYSGWADGTQMQLTVSLPETGSVLGPFTLGLGQQALLSRCG